VRRVERSGTAVRRVERSGTAVRRARDDRNYCEQD
jgi:hypothetical protein